MSRYDRTPFHGRNHNKVETSSCFQGIVNMSAFNLTYRGSDQFLTMMKVYRIIDVRIGGSYDKMD